MKKITLLSILIIPFLLNGQSRVDSLFKIGDTYFENKELEKAKEVFTTLKSELEIGSSDYNFAADRFVNTFFLGKDDLRNKGKYLLSIEYLNNLITLIKKDKEYIRPMWNNEKIFYLTKTIIQNYFSLNQSKKAKPYQKILYKAYKNDKLPEGISDSYSFEMFKWEDKNVWGYEWFEELPEDRFSKSFSKIVYYVYSTNLDGSDKEQLFRLHVLMYHNINKNVKIDYVLTKRLETATDEVSGTLYDYTYQSPIDYKKLKKDVVEVLKGNYQVNSKTKKRKTE